MNAGVGYGLTHGSDRLMAKVIIGSDLTPGTPAKPMEGNKLVRKAVPAIPRTMPAPQ